MEQAMGNRIDITGQKFNRWTVLEYSHSDKFGSYWKCRCNCGTEKVLLGSNVRYGKTHSCGCNRIEFSQNKLLDITGKRFNRWTVIEHYGNSYWLCRCDCGTEKIIHGNNLRRGYSKSCGCLNVEKAREKGKASAKHNMYQTRIYKIWSGMKHRCQTPSAGNYHNYGGRGITVCEEWQEFLPFYEWAMANGYEEHLTIDRINVNGNYEPSNCRWATWHEQALNRRKKGEAK